RSTRTVPPPACPYTTLFRSVLVPLAAQSVDGRHHREVPLPEILVEQLVPPRHRLAPEQRQEAAAVDAGRRLEARDFQDRRGDVRSGEHTSELQSRFDLVCRL